MNLSQAFKMAVKSILSKKMRSLLTMLGIIIGVAAVVIMVSTIQGQNKKNMEYIESQGTNKIEVYAWRYDGKDVSQDLYNYCLSLSDLVEGITPNGQINSEVVVKYGTKTYSTYNWDNWEDMITIYLGNDQYGLCNNYTIAKGRELSHLDVEKEHNVCVLGGRVAEQLILEDISTGASNDLQRATDTARAMVTRYGFSERMGPVVYGTDPGETFLGRDFGQGKGYSENTASEIDNEIRDIMDESYETARRILTEHMTELHRVAGVLMEREKISGEEFDALMKGENLAPFGLDTPAPAAAPASAEQPAALEQPSEPSDEN